MRSTDAPGAITDDQGRAIRQLRRFGLVVGGAFALLGGVLIWNGQPLGPYVLGAGTGLAALGLGAPRLLAPVERAWMKLALVLSVVMTHVILTLTFFLVITPVGLLRRLFVRDPLQLRRAPERTSYWTPVEADRPASRPDRPY